MDNDKKKIHEGDLYEVITVEGIRFEIRYGYYEDYERKKWEPMPIFPDLAANPVYTAGGEPVVTQMQDICEDYIRKPMHTDDERCADCVYFTAEDRKLIGVCKNAKRKAANAKKFIGGNEHEI